MSGGKVTFMGVIKVGSKAGAAQPATVLKSKSTSRKSSKYPSKAGRYGTTMVKEGKKQKRAT